MNGKKRVLVTGGTGYVGSDLVNKLLINHNIEIALVVRDSKSAIKMFGNAVIYIECNNLTEFNDSVLQFSPEIVVHLAAYSTSSDEPKDIVKLIESNIVFTSNLLIALSGCKLQLFINTGSFSEYHINNIISPTYFYSATKTSAKYIIEYYAKKNSFKFLNMILFTVYGKKNANKKIIDYAIDSLDSDEAVNMSDGKQILDFVHIDDVVNLYYNLILDFNNIKASKIDYDVGTGKCISIRDLVKTLESITNKKANIAWGANKSRKIDTIRACADIEMSQKELNYKVNISLESGLKKYIRDKI
ncbi:NAD(P)-dependent oxidoreductase [Sulfurimonas sp. NWX367]|uniref:NAD-dependent epimerase/dehydratase family protein n=1 Tax=Sulfurimonas sp. NWX367 TaxID=2925413 RepID=UPI0032049B34